MPKKKSFYRGYEKSQDKNVPLIPYELQYMFETALLTLAGSEKIPIAFCGDEVFRKIRQKFNNAIGHHKTKKVIKCLPLTRYVYLFLFFFVISI